MMGEASLETSPKNNMIQDMINSDNIKLLELSTHVPKVKEFPPGSCNSILFKLKLLLWLLLEWDKLKVHFV